MNFIIYEDEKDYATRYKNVIHKLLGATNLNYKIIEINEYNEETENKLDWKAQKEAQALERKRQNDLKKVETRIAQLEERDKEIDKEMEDPEVFTSVFKCQELSKEKDAILQELEDLYEQWENLAE